jgi:hypothetical protein
MDKRLEGVPLKVVEAGETLTLSTNTTNYRYRGIANPNYTCREQNHLKVGDMVVVQRVAPNKDMSVKGPCGCNYLLYDLVEERHIQEIRLLQLGTICSTASVSG